MRRRPSEWSEAQSAFRSRYASGHEALPRRPAHWRATPAMPSVAGPGVAGLVFVVHALRRARMRTPLNSAPLVAIWAADAPAGSRAMLVFEVAEMPSPTEGDGTLVGECGLNGALCLELGDGTVLWPTYNPRPPMTEVRR